MMASASATGKKENSFESYIPDEWIQIKVRKGEDHEPMEGVQVSVERISQCLHMDEAEEMMGSRNYSIKTTASLGRKEGSCRIERKRKAPTPRNDCSKRPLTEATIADVKGASRIFDVIKNGSLAWCGIEAGSVGDMTIDTRTGIIACPSTEVMHSPSREHEVIPLHQVNTSSDMSTEDKSALSNCPRDTAVIWNDLECQNSPPSLTTKIPSVPNEYRNRKRTSEHFNNEMLTQNNTTKTSKKHKPKQETDIDEESIKCIDSNTSQTSLHIQKNTTPCTTRVHNKKEHSKDTEDMPSTDITIEPVNDTTPLLSDGAFSWWNIDPMVESITIKEIPKCQYPSDLFNNTSRYGTVKISLSIKSILECYERHYKDMDEKNGDKEASNDDGGKRKILFKNGGTLGYKHETCYVIIVCMTGRDGSDPLPQFTNLPEVDISNGIQLHINNPYSMINGETVRWDHYKFAFHFPKEKEVEPTFQLNPKDIELSFVKHSIYRRGGGGAVGGARKPAPVPWCTNYYKCTDYHLNRTEMKRKKEKVQEKLKEDKAKAINNN